MADYRFLERHVGQSPYRGMRLKREGRREFSMQKIAFIFCLNLLACDLGSKTVQFADVTAQSGISDASLGSSESASPSMILCSVILLQ